MSTSLRTLRGLQGLRVPARALSTTVRRADAKPSPTTPAPADVEARPTQLNQQAPNRLDIWARGQQPRTKAMTGPRFEQTDGTMQVGFVPMTPGGDKLREPVDGGDWAEDG